MDGGNTLDRFKIVTKTKNLLEIFGEVFFMKFSQKIYNTSNPDVVCRGVKYQLYSAITVLNISSVSVVA